MKNLILSLLAVFSLHFAVAQIEQPVKWTFSAKTISETEGKLIFKAKIDKGWHLYSQFIGDGGPVPTSFTIKGNKDFEPVGKVAEVSKAVKLYEKAFEMNLIFFENEAVFEQKIKIKAGKDFKASGELEFMVCDDSKCLPPEVVSFDIPVQVLATSTETVTSPLDTQINNTTEASVQATDSSKTEVAAVDGSSNSIGGNANDSLWVIFVGGFVGGLLALLTPCVFPMIPLTVSFFTKRAANRRKGIMSALIYGLSIIGIYVLLGLGVTVIFGADALNDMASNVVFNLVFFAMLVVFGISFLGAFEIVLPNSFINKIDSKSDTSGLIGIFFMAFTLALVSFSCTGPIIGSLLVQAAVTGSTLGPLIGMFGFSFALSLPFMLFAIFPTWLQSLPKSGGWLNSVKVVLGFLELAFSLKFLSNVDLAYHWGVLDREVFLVIWIVLFFLLGLYLLGKLKFSHDSDIPYVSIPRLCFATAALAFSLYMVPGLWGAPLNAISAFAPPSATQDFDLSEVNTAAIAPKVDNGVVKKYADLFECPHNLNCYFDLEQGIEVAKKENKPVFVDFTGHACVNCRKMEASVWSNPEVLQRMNNDYIIVSLYVDDKTDLPESEQYISKFSGKKIKTLGNKWSDLQASRYNVNSQPYYVLLDHEQNLLTKPEAYNQDIENYIRFLEEGKKQYATKK